MVIEGSYWMLKPQSNTLSYLVDLAKVSYCSEKHTTTLNLRAHTGKGSGFNSDVSASNFNKLPQKVAALHLLT